MIIRSDSRSVLNITYDRTSTSWPLGISYKNLAGEDSINRREDTLSASRQRPADHQSEYSHHF